jgi:hypothetical protein
VLLSWEAQRQKDHGQVSSNGTANDGSAERGLFSTEHGQEKARVRVCAVGSSAEVVRFGLEVGSMSVNGKDYFLITGMTEEFRKWDKETRGMNTNPGEGPNDKGWQSMTMIHARLWELRIQLAIAQQLSVISAHLGQIVGKGGGGK